MRKIYPVFLLILFCFSCKKDKQVSEKTYSVTLNASGFSQQVLSVVTSRAKVIGPHTAPATPVGPGVFQNIYYSIFNTSGALLTFLHQDNTVTNEGTMQTYLPAGTYNVYISAGGSGLSNSYDGAHVILGSANNWEDTFYGSAQITVSGAVNQNITLNRVISQLQVTITDALPAGATTMSVQVVSDDWQIEPSKTPAPFSAATRNFQFTIPAASIGTSGNTYTGFIGNTVTPFKVIITCYDASNNPLGSATVNNVTCQVNKKTNLQGNLFGSSVGFGLTLTTLNPTPITQQF